MASSGGGGGVPLGEYRRDVPPGWSPKAEAYPLRVYFEKVKLWYRIFDGADEQVGPLLAGRLQGSAQKLAMRLRLIRVDGTYDVGDSALVRLRTEEIIDPATNTITQAEIPSGVQALCAKLKEAYGLRDQDQAVACLDSYFDLRRGKLSLAEFTTEYDQRYEDATDKAGLVLNTVAHSYLWLKWSGMPPKSCDDLKLQVNGDLTRFEELRSLALRMAHAPQSEVDGLNLYADDYDHDYDLGENADYSENFYGSTDDYDWWDNMEDDWYQDASYYDEPYENYEQEPSWNDYGWDEAWPEEPAVTGDGTSTELEASANPAFDEAYWGDKGGKSKGGKGYKGSFTPKGKGKGKGTGSVFGIGCDQCGSRWHNKRLPYHRYGLRRC